MVPPLHVERSSSEHCYRVGGVLRPIKTQKILTTYTIFRIDLNTPLTLDNSVRTRKALHEVPPPKEKNKFFPLEGGYGGGGGGGGTPPQKGQNAGF